MSVVNEETKIEEDSEFTNAIQVDLGSQNSILNSFQARVSFDSITKFWLNIQHVCRFLTEDQDTFFEVYSGINVLGDIVEPGEEIDVSNNLSRRRLSNGYRGKTKGLCRGDKCPQVKVISFPYRRRLDELTYLQLINKLCPQTLLEALQENNPEFFGNLTEVKVLYETETIFADYIPCDTDACKTQYNAVTTILDDFDITEYNPELELGECFLNYVNCNVDTDVVTSLIFFSEAISSTLPTDIGLLEKLEWFDLPNNNLTGTIPTEIFNISSLKGFTVPNNNLNGTIPKEIGALKNITNLNLSGNGFQGTIPTNIGLLENLETLDLSGNGLTGTVPSELGSLKGLKRVNLRGNKNLTGIIYSSNSCDFFEFDEGLVACSTMSPTESPSLSPTISSSAFPSGSPTIPPISIAAKFLRETGKHTTLVIIASVVVLIVSLILLCFCAWRRKVKKTKK